MRATENDGKGSRKDYLWVILAVRLGLVYFFYDDGSRSEDIILEELKRYEGTIQFPQSRWIRIGVRLLPAFARPFFGHVTAAKEVINFFINFVG